MCLLYFSFIQSKSSQNKIHDQLIQITGSIPVNRTWRESGKDIKRDVDHGGINKIIEALKNGWVIGFPQGATDQFIPIRKGTAKLIKATKALVVPIACKNTDDVFYRKNLFDVKGTGKEITISFKKTLKLNYQEDDQVILDQIMDGIEQSEKFRPKPGDKPSHEENKTSKVQ